MIRSFLKSAVLVLGVAVLIVPTLASAQVPTRVPFQGLLLDSGGTPVNGSVDLDFELFDALVAGTSLWNETHLGVVAVDGVYSVDLGSTVPLTETIVGGGSAFLEITVSGETLVPRQQLLSVPFALKAASAETLGNTPSIFFSQIVNQFNFDGQDPGNFHPDEGTGDVDGDGVANFIDADNDNDLVDDAAELAAGRPINIVDPTITSYSPNPVPSYASTTITVTGLKFDTLNSVTFGSETPTPTALTSTSFNIDVLAESAAATLPLTVTIANGQSNVANVPLVGTPPTVTDINPSFAQAGRTFPMTITGTNFIPGTVVQMGGQTFNPNTLTPTQLTLTITLQTQGIKTLSVIHPNLLTANQPFNFIGSNIRLVFVTSTTTDGDFGSVTFADNQCQTLATSAGLPGTYLAWISEDPSAGTRTPASVFFQNPGPYQMLGGTVIANNWTDLTNYSIIQPINRDETNSLQSFSRVWTGTEATGAAAIIANATCANWTSSNGADTAVVGANNTTGGGWSRSALDPCSTQARFYCFQQ